jgi:hypothetical protein
MLGIDPVEARRRGSLTNDELLRAAYRSADESYYLGTKEMKYPQFWSQNPGYRLLATYKPTAFRTQKLVKDALKRAYQTGGWSQFATRVATLLTLFPAAGEIVQGLYNVTAGRWPWDRDKTWHPTDNAVLDEILNAYSHTLTLGISYGLARSVAYRGGASDWLVGPIIGFPSDVIYSGKQALVDGNYVTAAKRLLYRVPVFGPLAVRILEHEEEGD